MKSKKKAETKRKNWKKTAQDLEVELNTQKKRTKALEDLLALQESPINLEEESPHVSNFTKRQNSRSLRSKRVRKRLQPLAEEEIPLGNATPALSMDLLGPKPIPRSQGLLEQLGNDNTLQSEVIRPGGSKPIIPQPALEEPVRDNMLEQKTSVDIVYDFPELNGYKLQKVTFQKVFGDFAVNEKLSCLDLATKIIEKFHFSDMQILRMQALTELSAINHQNSRFSTNKDKRNFSDALLTSLYSCLMVLFFITKCANCPVAFSLLPLTFCLVFHILRGSSWKKILAPTSPQNGCQVHEN